MITVSKITGTDGLVIILDSVESVTAFKELVHRATNLWPDATPEIKEFADVVTNADWLNPYTQAPNAGRGLQDYKGQDTSVKKIKGEANGN